MYFFVKCYRLVDISNIPFDLVDGEGRAAENGEGNDPLNVLKEEGEIRRLVKSH